MVPPQVSAIRAETMAATKMALPEMSMRRKRADQVKSRSYLTRRKMKRIPKEACSMCVQLRRSVKPARQRRRKRRCLTNADGHVDVETPPPGCMISDETAQKRAQRGSHDGTDAHNSHVLPALPQRNNVGDDGLNQEIDASAAEPLNGARRDEHAHRGGGAAEPAAEREEGDGAQEEMPAAEDVACLAGEGEDGDLGEEVGVGDPDVGVAAAEGVGYAGEGGGDDCSFDGGHEACDGEGCDDGPEAPCLGACWLGFDCVVLWWYGSEGTVGLFVYRRTL